VNALRLTARAHPFEIRGLLLIAVVGIGGAVIIIARLLAFGIPEECFVNTGGLVPRCIGFDQALADYGDVSGPWGHVGLLELIVLTVVPSVILGIALAAKEIDRGTTAFVWSLTTSRRRWFFARVAPVAITIVGLGIVAGVLTDELQALSQPGLDPARTFVGLGVRGPVLPAIALAVFGLTLLGGAVAGRILPALMAAIVLGFMALAGVTAASDAMLNTEVLILQPEDGMEGFTGHGQADWRIVDFRLLAPDGSLLDYQTAYERFGDRIVVSVGGQLPPSDEIPKNPVFLRQVTLANPGDVYPLAAARMAVLYGAVGLVAIVLAFAVIQRRRP
jgi:hypothetical protein